MESARKAKDDVWITYAAVLIAQIQGLNGFNSEALQYYKIAESAARRLGDQLALTNIIWDSSKLKYNNNNNVIYNSKSDETDDNNENNNIDETTIKLRKPKIHFTEFSRKKLATNFAN